MNSLGGGAISLQLLQQVGQPVGPDAQPFTLVHLLFHILDKRWRFKYTF